jgi:ATP-binding cassette subfamily F protein uup
MPRGVDEYLELRRASLAASSSNTGKAKSSNAAEERQLKKDLARVEKQIAKIRSELSELQGEQEDAGISPERFLEVSEKLKKLNDDLDVREEEWLLVTEKLGL